MGLDTGLRRAPPSGCRSPSCTCRGQLTFLGGIYKENTMWRKRYPKCTRVRLGTTKKLVVPRQSHLSATHRDTGNPYRCPFAPRALLAVGQVLLNSRSSESTSTWARPWLAAKHGRACRPTLHNCEWRACVVSVRQGDGEAWLFTSPYTIKLGCAFARVRATARSP